jgi:hypothetical protein
VHRRPGGGDERPDHARAGRGRRHAVRGVHASLGGPGAVSRSGAFLVSARAVPKRRLTCANDAQDHYVVIT